MLLRLIALLVSFTPLLSAMDSVPSLADLCLKTVVNYELDPTKLPLDCKQLIKEELIRQNGAALWAVAIARENLEKKEWEGNAKEAIALSPDHSIVVIASNDNIVWGWDLKANKFLYSLGDHNGVITSVSITLDGNSIVTKSSNGKVKIWDVHTGQLIKTIDDGSPIKSINLNIQSDFVLRFTGKLVQVEDRKDRTKNYTFEDESFNMLNLKAKSNDGTFIARRCETNRNCVEIYDTEKEKVINVLGGVWTEHLDEVTAVAISADNTFIVTGSKDTTAKLWDAKTGNLIRTFGGPLRPFSTHQRGITAVAISPDNTFIATGSDDRTVKLWDTKTGKLISTLSGHEGTEISSITIDPSNTCITILCDRWFSYWKEDYGYLWKITDFVNSLLDEKVSLEDALAVIKAHRLESSSKGCAIQ